jgi:hypothetical protein
VTEGPTTLHDAVALTDQLGIYPNPAIDHAMLTFPGNLHGIQVNITVTDVSGREMYAVSSYSGKEFQIVTRTWSQGVYFVTVTAPSGKMYGARLVR